jgi:hypothetical protein
MVKDKIIYITVNDSGYKLTVSGDNIMCHFVQGLCSQQEEADTKMFLAVKIAQEIGCTKATIFTVDSDVAILALYYARFFQIPLFIHIGTCNNIKVLDVTSTELTPNFVGALPSLHAISGCDSVSAFHGIGKSKWLTIVENNEEFQDAMNLLGESLTISETLYDVIEQMVCCIYGMKDEVSINLVRFKKFCTKKFPQPDQLPPTKDELKQHIKRSNYQSFLWKHALVRDEVITPVGHGWKDDNGSLEIVWMENPLAPNSIIELTTCNCGKSICEENCQCKILSIECTDLCKCRGNCGNIDYKTDESGSEEENGSNSEDDIESE